jgi:hypothetical protein
LYKIARKKRDADSLAGCGKTAQPNKILRMSEASKDVSVAPAEPLVWTFFYGSYINLNVLREVNYVPEKWEVARLAGFDIRIQPRANLVRSDQHSVYGILATGTHAELNRLYAHAKDVLGETYLPEAVLAEARDGKYKSALCYVCPAMDSRPATNEYVDRIVVPAREYGFPFWYLQRLEAFRP